MRLSNSGPFARARRFRLAIITRSWQRAALVGAAIAVAAVPLAACGGGSGATLGPAALAANSAAAGSGSTPSAGTENGSAATVGSVPAAGAGVAASSGTTGISGNTASAGANAPTASYTFGPITTAPRTGFASSFPTEPAAPSTGSATGSPPTVPPAALAVTCPLPGPQSQAIPAGFEPVAVVRCVLVSIQPTEYRQEVAVSNLGPLLTALLAAASTGSSVAPGPKCLMPMPMVLVLPDHLALVGANGQVIEPTIPLSVCGDPTLAVLASLDALQWTTVN